MDEHVYRPETVSNINLLIGVFGKQLSIAKISHAINRDFESCNK